MINTTWISTTWISTTWISTAGIKTIGINTTGVVTKKPVTGSETGTRVTSCVVSKKIINKLITNQLLTSAFRCLILLLCLILSPAYSVADDDTPQPPVNINTADAQTLSTVLKGVGPSKAKAIIAYRENYGNFKSVDELAEVKGIGRSLIDINRELMTLE